MKTALKPPDPPEVVRALRTELADLIQQFRSCGSRPLIDAMRKRIDAIVKRLDCGHEE